MTLEAISVSKSLTPRFATVNCQRNKSSTKPPTSPLHPLPAPPDRGDFIAIDFVGPLPEDDGFNCVATMTDRLGADVRFIPTRNDITAEEFAAIFLHMRVDVATAQDNLTQAKIRQTIHANVHRRTEIVYQMGDEVLLSTMHRRRDYMGKGVRSFGQVVAVEPRGGDIMFQRREECNPRVTTRTDYFGKRGWCHSFDQHPPLGNPLVQGAVNQTEKTRKHQTSSKDPLLRRAEVRIKSRKDL